MIRSKFVSGFSAKEHIDIWLFGHLLCLLFFIRIRYVTIACGQMELNQYTHQKPNHANRTHFPKQTKLCQSLTVTEQS